MSTYVAMHGVVLLPLARNVPSLGDSLDTNSEEE